MMIVKKIAALMALAGFVLGVAACNTIAGVGADVKAAGGAVEKAADKAKPY
jgi:predicted small secreted protein